MRKGLIIVVALLAMASVMAAMAYNSATVTSAQTLKVTSTDKALLSLVPKPVNKIGNKDVTAYVHNDGTLHFNFGASGLRKEGFPGLQPGSTYTWDDLFAIHNRSAENLRVTVNVTGRLGNYITIYSDNEHKAVYDASGPRTFNVSSDSQHPLTCVVTIPVGSHQDIFDGEITVSVEAR